MESIAAYADNLAIENFREYLRIKTVQPEPDYGNICSVMICLFLVVMYCCFMLSNIS